MATHAEDVQSYMKGVLDGSIVTGRLERLTVRRHVLDLVNAGERGFYFDEDIANEAIDFSGCCNQFEGEWAGKPLKLRCEQKFIVWCLFGWRQTSDGMRRYRTAFIDVARKWGKSTLAAYLSCLLLLFDHPIEMGAQGYCAATKQKQAEIVWQAAVNMIEASPSLNSQCKITPSTHNIAVTDTKSFFRPIASESKKADGFSPHFVVKDEYHQWQEHHRGLNKTLKSGFGARTQPLTLVLTTHGDEFSLIWIEDLNYSIRALESVISGEIVDDSWFAFVATLDYPHEAPCFGCLGDECPWCNGTGAIPIDDPFDEKVWRKANPGIGITPRLDRFRESALSAKQRPEDLTEFLRKNVNVLVSSKERPIPPETWVACAGELSDWSDAEDIRGGFDLGRSDDFSSTAMVARFTGFDDDGDTFTRYECLAKSWTCSQRHETMRTDQIARWIASGDLVESPGSAVDLIDVENQIVAWSEQYPVGTWAFDHTFAPYMAQRLLGLHALPIFDFTQRARYYTQPIIEFRKLMNAFRIVRGQKVPLFRHNGCKVLAWQASNLILVRNPGGETMPDKSNPKNKIDSMVSILMAFSECLYAQKEEVNSDYKYGDLRG